MKNKETTLVFDFNNLAMRSLFTCIFSGGREGVMIKDFSTEAEQGIFIRKLAIDMTFVMRLINPSRVIVCCDDRYPWRKKLLESEEIGYKGTRHKDEDKDWDAIFGAMSKYKDILRSKNIIVYEIENGEADDLAAFVKKDIFTNLHNNIIYVSSDKDWLQLIDFDPDYNNFCAVLNPIANNHKKKVLSVHQDCYDWINQEDPSTSLDDIFFTNTDNSKTVLKSIFNNTNINVSILDPKTILLSKLFCGDQSDNIPSFYEFIKNGKLSKITESKMNKIVEEFGLSSGSDFIAVSKKPEFKSFIEKLIKHEISDINIEERAERQRKLVELNTVLFPKSLCENYDYMSNNIKETGKLSTVNIKLEDLLSGTQFYDENYKKAKRSDIFDDLKDLDKYIISKPETNSLF